MKRKKPKSMTSKVETPTCGHPVAKPSLIYNPAAEGGILVCDRCLPEAVKRQYAKRRKK